MERANAYYQLQLREHADAEKCKDYLKNRGLTGKIAKAFQIGFAPSGWENLKNFLHDIEPEKLLRCGLVIQNEQGRIYDRFRDRIMFPIRDRRGRVIGFGGRVLTDETPKYLNSPETPIFHKGSELYGLYEALQNQRQLDEIIVVEGYMERDRVSAIRYSQRRSDIGHGHYASKCGTFISPGEQYCVLFRWR